MRVMSSFSVRTATGDEVHRRHRAGVGVLSSDPYLLGIELSLAQ
jgi:hypothetical protein